MSNLKVENIQPAPGISIIFQVKNQTNTVMEMGLVATETTSSTTSQSSSENLTWLYLVIAIILVSILILLLVAKFYLKYDIFYCCKKILSIISINSRNHAIDEESVPSAFTPQGSLARSNSHLKPKRSESTRSTRSNKIKKNKNPTFDESNVYIVPNYPPPAWEEDMRSFPSGSSTLRTENSNKSKNSVFV